MEVSTVFVSLLIILLFSLYKYLKRNDNFFSQRGVEFLKPTLFFGNMLDVFLDRESEARLFEDLYDLFSRERLFGVFIMQRCVFVIKDIELIKQIMITNFDNFSNYAGNEFDSAEFEGLFQKSLMFLEKHEWRVMREVLEKVYAKSSVQKIHQNLLISAENSLIHIQKGFISNEEPFIIDTKEVLERLISESIAGAIFGSSDKISEILQVIKLIECDLTSFSGSIKLLLNSRMPKNFKTKIFRNEIHEFFNKNLTQEIQKRLSRGKTESNDLIQMIIECSRESELEAEAITEQFLIFFTGGFRSTLILLQRCFYEIARNPKVQQQLINEVDNIDVSSNGVSCEVLSSLRYLEALIFETLRKWPPIPYGSRVCTKDCTIMTNEGELLKFLKGDLIHLPFKLIQNDSKYFPNPELFNPSRVQSDLFLAFGLGPRRCVGSHFILLQLKLFIYTFLRKFSIRNYKQGNMDLNNDNMFLLELTLRK